MPWPHDIKWAGLEATILSNESKDKQLDTFKAHFTNKDGVKTEVEHHLF